MPVAFVLLLIESRAAGPHRWLKAGAGPAAFAAALAAASLALFAVGGLYAAVLDWSHALVRFSLAGALSLLLAAALVALSDERVQLIPFNWSALAAAGLWPLCAPIPPGTYTRITIALQSGVSTGVVHALHLLGIAASRTGNVIELATTSVGVEEACSGIRSLVSCVFVGVFFSASLVRRPWARALVIVLAPALALAMNFARSLILTLLANGGVNIAGLWHDLTGYSVLGVTAAILAAIALLLRSAPAPLPGRDASVDLGPASGRPGISAVQAVLASALLLAAALSALFYANTRPSARRSAPVPDLWAMLPESAPGWRVATTRDLYQFSGILQTDHLAQRTYGRPGETDGDQVVLYLAYWRPGQAAVSLVASHTPDACWPGAGWEAHGSPSTRSDLAVGGRRLPPAQEQFFSHQGYPQYVWFWHIYDGRPIAFRNPYSIRELLGIALQYGFRHDGDQLFVRVSGNRPWQDLSRDPFVTEFFAHLRPYGL